MSDLVGNHFIDFLMMGLICLIDDSPYIFYRDAQIAVKQLLELPTAPIEGEDSDKPELSARLLYKCLICMRKFRGSNYLKLHMRNHTGRKILLELLYLILYIQGSWGFTSP